MHRALQLAAQAPHRSRTGRLQRGRTDMSSLRRYQMPFIFTVWFYVCWILDTTKYNNIIWYIHIFYVSLVENNKVGGISLGMLGISMWHFWKWCPEINWILNGEQEVCYSSFHCLFFFETVPLGVGIVTIVTIVYSTLRITESPHLPFFSPWISWIQSSSMSKPKPSPVGCML